MKRFITTAALFTLFATTLLAHAGEVHTYLGTIKTLSGNEMVITDREGELRSITLVKETRYWKGTAAATRADLVVGGRVSVEIGIDGRTATTVKIGAKPKS